MIIINGLLYNVIIQCFIQPGLCFILEITFEITFSFWQKEGFYKTFLEKHDEFKRWISIRPMKDIIFNEIVCILGICGNYIYYFNNLNKEYSSTYLKD